MGIDFYLAKNLKDINSTMDYAGLDEEIFSFLYRQNDIFQNKLDLLISLDPYGEKIFNKDEVKKLLEISEYLISYFSNEENYEYFTPNLFDQNFTERDIIKFANELNRICKLALNLNDKTIVFFGD